jgi:hypothetical protein
MQTLVNDIIRGVCVIVDKMITTNNFSQPFYLTIIVDGDVRQIFGTIYHIDVERGKLTSSESIFLRQNATFSIVGLLLRVLLEIRLIRSPRGLGNCGGCCCYVVLLIPRGIFGEEHKNWSNSPVLL